MSVDLWKFVRDNIIGRDEFIETPFGKRLLVYADYTASGRGLEFFERYFESILKLYANTHTDDDTTGEVTTDRFHQAEKKIKKYVNADDRYCVIEVGSGTTGAINRLQEIIGIYIPPVTKEYLKNLYSEFVSPDKTKYFFEYLMEKRPVVFIGPYEHHSNEISWRECFCEVVNIELGKNGEIDLEDLKKKVNRREYAGRFKIGSFSAASNVTGVLTPVYEIARILHENDSFVFFDFAAAAPYREINVNHDEKSYFDAIFFSPHKFLGGPGSCGILVFRKDLYHGELPPTYSGGGTVAFVNFDKQSYSSIIEVREKPGTPPILQTMRSALVLELKDRLGQREIDECEFDINKKVLNKLKSLKNIEIYGPLDPRKRLSIYSFNVLVDGVYLHPKFVVRLLNDLFGIQARAGCSCAGPYGHRLLGINKNKSERYYEEIVKKGRMGIKPGWVRVNFHFLILPEEMNYILNAIEFVAEYGKYFLPIYKFDISSGAWLVKGWKKPKTDFDLESAINLFINYNIGNTKEKSRDLYNRYMKEAIEYGEKYKRQFTGFKIIGEYLIPFACPA